ncbi:hypothetical protein CRENBAI_020167 [Crenichthys baileyi]|uniref:Uncharacterized protein n=1 Tax=Crenichthys baileyi TaxID=28760 RepID=A0AAV9R1C4_9TELE
MTHTPFTMVASRPTNNTSSSSLFFPERLSVFGASFLTEDMQDNALTSSSSVFLPDLPVLQASRSFRTRISNLLQTFFLFLKVFCKRSSLKFY